MLFPVDVSVVDFERGPEDSGFTIKGKSEHELE